MFKTLLALSLVSALSASSLQFEITYKPQGGKMIGTMLDRTILTIVSLNDQDVLIKKVIPNRGNSCTIVRKVGNNLKEKFEKGPLFNHTLKYAQKIAYRLKCDPSQFLEVEIVTDKGTYTKKFR
ncbi:hypothetical protein [Helicobacter sp. NHP22-001]|uniref:hypothetical protein n=1 Tax=Helicobacter sp. NHP22-001 TaxID=3040202 RepID=UPI00244D813D|nr:hypothetical protein [Helicobacter sp. NHP22-001]GMB96802.1 Hypothetical protein NHP22001_13910 [Helicobacter sp. NHP22-001]